MARVNADDLETLYGGAAGGGMNADIVIRELLDCARISPALDAMRVPIGSLNLDLKNARTHGEANLAAIRDSLQRFGQRLPVVVQAQGMVVRAGNGRVVAARQLGWDTIAAVIVDESDVEATAFALVDNRSSELAEWDDDTLRQTLAVLEAEGAKVVGWTDKELEALRGVSSEAEQDDVPAPPEIATAKVGQLWALGEHRVLCGDCRGSYQLEQLADMVWTDPPYGVGIGKKTRHIQKHGGGTKTRKHSDLEGDIWHHKALGELLRSALMGASDRCRSGAAWFVTAPPGRTFQLFAHVLLELDIWHQTLVWVKEHLVFGRSDYHYRHELILYGWKPDAAHTPPPDRKQDSVLEYPSLQVSKHHPTMKPVELVAYCIGNHTRPGDLVLDPFLGSGTTLIACEQLGRQCFGVEIEPRYVDVVVQRWQNLTGKRAEVVDNGELALLD